MQLLKKYENMCRCAFHRKNVSLYPKYMFLMLNVLSKNYYFKYESNGYSYRFSREYNSTFLKVIHCNF